MKRIGDIQVGISGQPFGAECHPSMSPMPQFALGRSLENKNLPSVQFRGTQYDNPVMTRRVILDNLAQNITAKWSSTKDSQQFKGYDRWV